MREPVDRSAGPFNHSATPLGSSAAPSGSSAEALVVDNEPLTMEEEPVATAKEPLDASATRRPMEEPNAEGEGGDEATRGSSSMTAYLHRRGGGDGLLREECSGEGLGNAELTGSRLFSPRSAIFCCYAFHGYPVIEYPVNITLGKGRFKGNSFCVHIGCLYMKKIYPAALQQCQKKHAYIFSFF